MPRYNVGGQRIRRKNLYMPCVIGPRFEAATPDEQAAIFKETYWADNITAAEWPVVLGDVRNPSAKSRLKRKLVGWLMAEGRIAVFAPRLYLDAVDEAAALYRKQIGHSHPTIADSVVSKSTSMPTKTGITSAASGRQLMPVKHLPL